MTARLSSATLAALAMAAGTSAAAPAVAPRGTQPGGLAGATPPADSASKCSSCHSGGVADDGVTFRPWDTWSGTMMAHATRDPLFLAALTVSEQDAPGSGAFCLRCHTPKGFVKGNATGVGAALDADDNQGVDCEGCHRSIDGSKVQPALEHDGKSIAALDAVDPMAPYVGNARLYWDTRDVRHGPYDDADSPAHAAAGSTFGSSSQLCGQCHEVLSPLRNLLTAGGQDTGFPFPLDTTYTEWASSDFGRAGADRRSCIDCHMPPAKGDSLTVSTYPSAMRRAAPRMHLFVGGNAWGLDAVQAAAPALAVERGAAFEATKAAVATMLAGAVQLDVMPVVAVAGETKLQVQVRVTNLSGHKFPTGYADGRRAFLQVELTAAGKSLAVLGTYDEATQALDVSATRVWESVQAERLSSGGHHEWHIAKNDTVVSDTRIPPKGFRPVGAAAVAMTAPVGADYGPADGTAALRNFDDVTVRFASLPALQEGAVKVTARVFYQSTVREFIDELVAANKTDDRGTTLKAIWEQTGRAAPRLIHSKTVDVVVAPAPDSGCGCQVDVGTRTAPSAGAAALLLALLVRRRRMCK